MDWSAVASAGGNLASAAMGMSTASDNAELQKQFAKQGIRWRVADAQAAGIHPLYALGANVSSYQPISTGDVSQSFSNMGQDLSTAINSTRTDPEKIDAYTGTLRAKQLERAGLENDLLRSQIAQLNTPRANSMASAGDPYLITGQANSGLKPNIVDKPLARTAGAPGQPWSEPGAITDLGYARTPTGWAPVPSKDVKERIEDSAIPEMMWSMRNNILPSFGADMQPPFKAPPGKEWRFNILRQEYQLIRKSTPSPSSPTRRHNRETFGNRF